MVLFPPTLILRHKKENLKKCSLRGLEGRSDIWFFTYPKDPLPDLSGYLLLAVEAPPLSPEDAPFGLFLLDATWRYAARMHATLPPMRQRSIPVGYLTAYPRRQSDCPRPEQGLASVEALFVAARLLGRDTSGFLDHYHWKEKFLLLNQKKLYN